MAREIFRPDYLPYRQEKKLEFQISYREKVFLSPHSFSPLEKIHIRISEIQSVVKEDDAVV
ncbi:MAG: hypothetical protein ACFFEE_01780 [Candidatus Thorarchaeota archaeon]